MLDIISGHLGIGNTHYLYVLVSIILVLVLVLPQRWYVRLVAFMCAILLSFAFMGWPMVYCPSGQVRAGFTLDKVGQYLVVDVNGSPIFCSMPWNESEAEELQNQLQSGREFYYDPGYDDKEQMYYNQPQEGTPPKPEYMPPTREFGV